MAIRELTLTDDPPVGCDGREDKLVEKVRAGRYPLLYYATEEVGDFRSTLTNSGISWKTRPDYTSFWPPPRADAKVQKKLNEALARSKLLHSTSHLFALSSLQTHPYPHT